MSSRVRGAAALVCSLAPLWSQVNVLTVNYDNNRTNANLNETALNSANVAPGAFGKLYSLPVDGQVYAQPLYVSQINVAGQNRSVLFIATMHNSVYAFDTAAPPDLAPLWTVNLGPPVPNSYYNFNDIQPEVGVLSTPVIDLEGGVIYAVANTLENGACRYRLHALDLATGAEKAGSPVVIAASVQGSAPDAVQGALSFAASDQLQRPGLLLAGGVVYLAFGSHGDELPYHGWILGYDAATLQLVTAFNTTPDGMGGSVWQAGHGMAADDQALYAIVANGDVDNSTNWGETILKLKPQDLSIVSWFTPNNASDMNSADFEIGNAGPVLIPGADLMIGGGKLGDLYLLRRSDGELVQTLSTVNFGFFSRAAWSTPSGVMFYVSGWDEAFKAYWMSSGQFDDAPASETSRTFLNPYVGMAISGNGGNPSSAILWATTADRTTYPTPGTLRAFDATDISRELWNSDMNPGDAMGSFAKFAIPTIADGRVYVPTFSNQVAVYGLLGGAKPLLRSGPRPEPQPIDLHPAW